MFHDGVNKEVLEKANLRDRIVSYGILFDKRQLLTGKPTQNVFSLTAIIKAAHEPGRDSQDKAEEVVDITPEGQGESGV